jgi:uncharacterized protein with HEPN domain
MLPERDQTALEDMLAYAREAIAASRGRRREDLDKERFLYLGLQRLVEVIGEAATRVSRETRDQYPGIRWPLIIGMRNRLIHGYDVVHPDVVWDTLLVDLPPLVRDLEGILAMSAEEGARDEGDEG